MTDSLTKRDQPDRSKINMNQGYEVHYWTKRSSAAAVRKELAV